MDNLQELRDEYGQGGPGELLRELLGKIVWSTVRQYPPSEYSSYGNWDKAACEDVLSDWIAERLWGRADLQAMLSSSVTAAQLRAALTTSLRQFLSNKRRRSIASNLYKRVRTQLKGSRFRALRPSLPGTEQQWTLAETESTARSSLSVGELVSIAWGLTDEQLEVIRYGPFSQKLSPILREPKLMEFLQHLLHRSSGSLDLATILDVMRLRFGLVTEEHIELDDSVPSPTTGRVNEAEIAVAARSIISRLDVTGTRMLAAYFESGGNFSDAATRSGGTIENVRETVYTAFAAICECSESEEDARSIMNAVESLLIQRGD